jgi:hypothetical protein
MRFTFILLTLATQALSVTLCGHEASVSKCKPIDCNYDAIKCLITDDFTSPTDLETGSKTPTTQQPWKCFICDHDFSKLLNPKALAGLVTAKKINVPKMCKVFRESEMSTHVIVHDEESKTIAYFSPRSDWPTTGVVVLHRRASGMRKFVSDMKIAVVVGAVCAVILLPVLIVVGILKGVFEFLVPPKSLCDSSNPYAPDW